MSCYQKMNVKKESENQYELCILMKVYNKVWFYNRQGHRSTLQQQ